MSNQTTKGREFGSYAQTMVVPNYTFGERIRSNVGYKKLLSPTREVWNKGSLIALPLVLPLQRFTLAKAKPSAGTQGALEEYQYHRDQITNHAKSFITDEEFNLINDFGATLLASFVEGNQRLIDNTDLISTQKVFQLNKMAQGWEVWDGLQATDKNLLPIIAEIAVQFDVPFNVKPDSEQARTRYKRWQVLHAITSGAQIQHA